MKLLQNPLFYFTLLIYLSTSCSSSSKNEDEITEIKLDSSNFELEYSGDLIQFNEHTFIINEINNSTDIYINYVDWYINNLIIDDFKQTSLKTSFKNTGNNNIKAKIYLSNDQIIEINKNIPITEKDFIYVYIHGLTINGIDESILNDFIYTSNGGDRLISLESRFKISNYEDGVINYISSRNFDNNRTKTLQSISWLYPINHEFHKVKIYADGIPDNLFNITFYGQNIEQSKPEEIMASTTVSLNDYRNIKPNNIDLNASHISYRLHVYWQ